MPDFRFVARSSSGQLLDGTVAAQDRAAAIQQVERQGAVPISIVAVQAGEPAAKAGKRSWRLYVMTASPIVIGQ